jgi:hypothetical protein
LRSRAVPKSNLGPFAVGAAVAGVFEVDGAPVGSTGPADGFDEPQAAASRHDDMSADVTYQDFLIQL